MEQPWNFFFNQSVKKKSEKDHRTEPSESLKFSCKGLLIHAHSTIYLALKYPSFLGGSRESKICNLVKVFNELR